MDNRDRLIEFLSKNPARIKGDNLLYIYVDFCPCCCFYDKDDMNPTERLQEILELAKEILAVNGLVIHVSSGQEFTFVDATEEWECRNLPLIPGVDWIVEKKLS